MDQRDRSQSLSTISGCDEIGEASSIIYFIYIIKTSTISIYRTHRTSVEFVKTLKLRKTLVRFHLHFFIAGASGASCKRTHAWSFNSAASAKELQLSACSVLFAPEPTSFQHPKTSESSEKREVTGNLFPLRFIALVAV